MEDSKKNDVLSGIEVKPARLPFHMYLLTVLSAFFHDLGKSVCEILGDLADWVLLGAGKVIGFVWVKTETFRIYIWGKLKYFGFYVFSPFLKFGIAFFTMRKETKAANREHGMKGALPVFFRHIVVFVFGKRGGGAVTTAFNYVIPIISVIFLVNIISYASDIEYAVRLEVNGTFVGYIENERVYTEAEKIFEQRVNLHGSTIMVEFTPRFTIEKLGFSNTLSASQVTNILLEQSGIVVEYAYGIIINNNFIGAVKDNEEILLTRDALLDVHRTGTPDEEVEFVWSFYAEQGDLYPVESIVEPAAIIRSITRINEEAQFYTIAEGDSHFAVSEMLDVSMAQLERFNPGFTGRELSPGDRIMFSPEVPHLEVAVTRTEVFDQEIPFATEYRDDASYFMNTQNTSVRGREGIDRITARVTLVNGIETRRQVTSREVVSLPVTQVISMGTRPLPQGTFSSERTIEGIFIWPVPREYRVSEWHWSDGGYRGHSGIDIGSPYGTPIFAGDSGTVIFSGWYSGGYGNTVIIEHPNSGLRTWYAHASAMNVVEGQEVSQGETIAWVGATGYADGNHLHFEVREASGRTLNPRPFLDVHDTG
ncbi:MAG: peptidoglycan DD-metalloendopeptidase family protein [Oscillospiraceae bacterium]|jgi:murein DD-endopeptidase MepM/ murein hydrolase activator NlpD|nr:peptidoglycan DD-metalloendopeptidase family protein [Oscillospiraceae bacterium]